MGAAPSDVLDRLGIRPSSVVHVGANTGQECETYRQREISSVVYVEPISDVYRQLEARVEKVPGHHAVQALCSDTDGQEVRFHVASNGGQSSSMLSPGIHTELYPNITFESEVTLTTTTLDTLLGEKFPDTRFSHLVMDAQGAELKILQGASRTLEQVESIWTEISLVPLYEGAPLWRDIDAFLLERGFDCHYLKACGGKGSWGDALYVKKGVIGRGSPMRPGDVPRSGTEIARGKPTAQSSRSRHSRSPFVEGALNGNLKGGYFFHTSHEARPWWAVDLGAEFMVDEVLVFNRLGKCAPRAFDFIARASLDGNAWTDIHSQAGRPFGGFDGDPARIAAQGRRMRYLMIQLPGTECLHLDGVEVYGRPVKNLDAGAETGEVASVGSSASPAALEAPDLIRA